MERRVVVEKIVKSEVYITEEEIKKLLCEKAKLKKGEVTFDIQGAKVKGAFVKQTDRDVQNKDSEKKGKKKEEEEEETTED